MKVKVGDKIYDGEKEPIMIILTDADKRNIASMHDDCAKYCQYPDGMWDDEIDEFMNTNE